MSMSRKFIACWALSCTGLLLAGMLSACVSTLPGAVMKFKTDSLYVPLTKASPSATVYYDFTNVGSEPVKVKVVRASCHCVTAEVEPMEIPSRGKGRVKVTVERPAAFRGPFEHEIGIYYNNVETPAMLKLSGELE